MGIFDRLKHRIMGARPTATEERPAITLDLSQTDLWPAQVTTALGLDDAFASFLEEVRVARDEVQAACAALTREKVIQRIPERARTVNELHAKEYATQARKLAESAAFDTLFGFEKVKEGFLRADEAWKEQTKRNASVLNEYLKEEAGRVQTATQRLEDIVIAFIGLLDERKFPLVERIHDAHVNLQELEGRAQKYHELLASLEEDRKRTEAKRARIRKEIQEQRSLVRNDDALQALDKLRKLEDDIAERSGRYPEIAHALKKEFAKQGLAPRPGIINALDDLVKDPGHTLATAHDRIQHAFRQAADQLDEEGRGSIRSLVSKTLDLANRVDDDGKAIAAAQPETHELKRRVMGDIAALRIYDQQQFLSRADREEALIARKIARVKEEIGGSHRIELSRQMKDAALALGAQLTGVDAHEQEDGDPEADDDGSDEPIPRMDAPLPRTKGPGATEPAHPKTAEPDTAGDPVAQAVAEAEQELSAAEKLASESEKELHR